MSPAERRFWLTAQRRAAGLQPEIARAILRAFQIIRDTLSEADLARLVGQGLIETLVTEALSESVMDRAMLPVRDRLRRALDTSFRYAVSDLPRGGKIDGVIAVQFDVLHPNVVKAITELDTKVITTLTTETRETVRQAVRSGLEAGQHPRAIAREIKDVIGLSPNQEAAVRNYRAELEAGRSGSQYKLRDKRLKPKTPAQIDNAVEAYRNRRIAQNAETNARTASLDAMKKGQQLSWQDAADKGIVDLSKMTKTWRGVKDTRERPEHIAMEGETVPIQATYSNGEDTPGDSTFNCRCVSVFRQEVA